VKVHGGTLRLLLATLVGVGLVGSASAQEKGPLTAGQIAPAFHAADQNGKKETLSALMGPKGTVLLFFRSADW
jgi:hypothetical protein